MTPSTPAWQACLHARAMSLPSAMKKSGPTERLARGFVLIKDPDAEDAANLIAGEDLPRRPDSLWSAASRRKKCPFDAPVPLGRAEPVGVGIIRYHQGALLARFLRCRFRFLHRQVERSLFLGIWELDSREVGIGVYLLGHGDDAGRWKSVGCESSLCKRPPNAMHGRVREDEGCAGVRLPEGRRELQAIRGQSVPYCFCASPLTISV